jgi:phosphate transport system permease protein
VIGSASLTTFTQSLRVRRGKGAIFVTICFAATMASIAILGILLFTVTVDGLARLSWDFVNTYPSRFPEQAGIRAALFGTLWMMAFTALIAVPLGFGAAIFLEEFAPRNWLTKIIETNINNLAGVPSIVYGILGLAVFVRGADLGRSVLAGSLTMALLVLPIIIVASREGLRSVPPSIRDGALALGATRWQTVRFQVLPPALPAMMTGVILALSRAIGEAAPLIIMGALIFVPFTPSGPLDRFTVLPIQIYSWIGRPQPEFADTAAAGIIVLLMILLTMNAFAVALRMWFERSRKW